MRGVGLFIAVFSVGLVLFMLLTGQLSEFFITDEDPFREQKLESDPDGLNHFSFPYVDPKTRRKAFDLSGVIESDSPIEFDASPLGRTDLADVAMSMFVYDDTSETDNVRIVEITAGRAQVKPESDVVELRNGIVCNDPDGTSFRTRSVKISLPEGQLQRATPTADARRTIQIEGTERVDLDHGGFLELASDFGLESEIDPDFGFRGLTIRPPVYVAVDPDRSGGFVGLPSSPDAGAGEATPETRVHVIGEGPLEIQTAGEALADGTAIHTATFRGGVTLFVAPGGTALDSELTVPVERLRSDELELELAVVNGRASLRSATARRGAEPVSLTRVLAASNENETSEVYELQCNAIEWSSETDEAHIIDDGRIVVRGPTGAFSAAKAWFENRERRLRLEDVRADLSIESFGLVGDAATRLAERWTLVAGRGSLKFDEPQDSSAGARRFFEAFGSKEAPVVLAEKRDGGISLEGLHVGYDDRTDVVRLERTDGVRPRFREGASELSANAIEVKSRNDDDERATEATFIGEVSGTVHGPTFTRWKPEEAEEPDDDVESATADLSADALTLIWSQVPGASDEDKPTVELTRIEATGREDTPATIAGRSVEKRSNAKGDRITWTRADGMLSVSGDRADQQVEWEDNARVTARDLQVDTMTNELRATGDVVAVVDGRALPRAEDPGDTGAVRSDVQITAETVRVGFVPRESGDASKTESAETREFRWRDATATGSPVEVRDAEFRVRAAEIEWRSQTSDDAESVTRETIIARGADQPGLERPSFRYLSEDGESFGFAERIEVLERESGRGYEIAFQGDVEFDLSERTLFRKDGEGPPKTSSERALRDEQRLRRWQIRAPLLEATLGRATGGSALASRELDLESVDGPKGVEVRSPQHGVRVTGTELNFLGGTGRLVLGGEQNSGTQRLERLRENGKLDHITADEIVLSTHPDEDRGAHQRVIVYFEKVLRASFAHDSGERQPDAGDVLEAGSDHMLVILDEPVASATGADAPASQIREAVMWGNVNFTSGRYRGLAQETRYTRRDRRVAFYGSEGDPPTLHTGRDIALRPETYSLEWKPDGRFTYIEEHSRKPMNRSELRRLLEQFDRMGAFREAQKTKP